MRRSVAQELSLNCVQPLYVPVADDVACCTTDQINLVDSFVVSMEDTVDRTVSERFLIWEWELTQLHQHLHRYPVQNMDPAQYQSLFQIGQLIEMPAVVHREHRILAGKRIL